MKDKIDKLKSWTNILETIIDDDIDEASEIMENLVGSVREDATDEEVKERVDEWMDDVNKKYAEMLEEIDEQTKERTPEDMKKRRNAYETQNRWRVGQLLGLLRGVMDEKVKTEIGEGD